MKPSLLITGAGGFVGRHLLEKLDYSKYHTVYCLSRKMEHVQIPDNMRGSESLKVIEADVTDVSSYQWVLEKVETVIHMAAATGKVSPKDYFKVNAYGTMILLDRCKQAGVKHFLFISTIAVSFKNKYRYFYAQSKEQAEEYVKNSGLKYTILRPTIITGKNSPVFDGMAALAGLPVIPVFGRGDIEIQPIDVQDVARAIVRIENETRYNNEMIELGGPEPVTIEAFMKMIAVEKGKENPKVMHIPMGLTVFGLSILEPVVYGLLPVTIGQLASFRNDGKAETNDLMRKLTPMMTTLSEMIKMGLEKDKLPEIPPMILKECRIFSRYLTGMEPNGYVMENYNRCHQIMDFSPADFHDSLLLKLARTGKFLTRTADAYSRFFRPNSALRKRLAYLMAILEVTPPYFRYFDIADSSGLFGFLIKTGLKSVVLAFHLFFAIIFLFPLQLLSRMTGKPKPLPQEE